MKGELFCVLCFCRVVVSLSFNGFEGFFSVEHFVTDFYCKAGHPIGCRKSNKCGNFSGICHMQKNALIMHKFKQVLKLMIGPFHHIYVHIVCYVIKLSILFGVYL